MYKYILGAPYFQETKETEKYLEDNMYGIHQYFGDTLDSELQPDSKLKSDKSEILSSVDTVA